MNASAREDASLTGSQMFRMMKNVTESLAGRVGIVPMQGLTNSEIPGQQPFPPFEVNVENLLKRLETTQPMSVTEVFERIYKGAMPHLYEIEKGLIWKPSLSQYLRDLFEQGHPRPRDRLPTKWLLLNFIKVVAARTATNVNYETLAQEVGVPAPTAKSWLSIHGHLPGSLP